MSFFSRISIIAFFSFAFSVFAQSPVPEGANLETIMTGLKFVEGPVWKDSVGLLFSDMNANTIYKWTPDSGKSVFLFPSDTSNGLTYDLQGRLIMAQCGLRRVSRLNSDGTETSLASGYKGKRLNSPNDLAVKFDGAIFFTDPPFNIPTGKRQQLSFAGIYRISPSGALQLLDSTLALPDGICFSPDQTKLYVNDSQVRIIYVWDVVDDSLITNKRKFASIRPYGYADGMKTDSAGNLFCVGPMGVWVFSPAGTLLDTILVPGTTSNRNWGDADRKTLYITGGNSVYRIRLTETTGIDKIDQSSVNSFGLNQNYPNPFNPSTTIEYSIGKAGFVNLKIYNVLGRKIKTLINTKEDAGNYAVRFDANHLNSGIYFYSIHSGNFVQYKKMLLLK
jgi:gluconolactonase